MSAKEPWLATDPLGGRDVFGAPSAMRCYHGDCKAVWCEPEECLREKVARAAQQETPQVERDESRAEPLPPNTPRKSDGEP